MVKGKIETSKLIIILLLLAVLVTTIVILSFLVFNTETVALFQGLIKPKEVEQVVSLDNFIVNLKPQGNMSNYISITLSLMSKHKDGKELIESNISKIRDVVIGALTTKTYGDMITSSSTEEIKLEIIENINNILGEKIIEGVYITDLLLQ